MRGLLFVMEVDLYAAYAGYLMLSPDISSTPLLQLWGLVDSTGCLRHLPGACAIFLSSVETAAKTFGLEARGSWLFPSQDTEPLLKSSRPAIGSSKGVALATQNAGYLGPTKWTNFTVAKAASFGGSQWNFDPQ